MNITTKRELGQKVFLLWKWKIHYTEIVGISITSYGEYHKEGYWLRGDFKNDEYFSEEKVFDSKEELVKSLEQ